MLSSLLFVAGIMILGSVVFLMNSAAIMAGDVKSVNPGDMMKSAGSAVLVVCAILTLLTGVMGCMVVKCQHRCFIIIFGSSLGCTSMIVFIIGCIFASTANWMPMTISALCQAKTGTSQFAYMDVSSMDTAMLTLNNVNMCTPKCPCDAADYSAGYSSISASNFTF